MSAPTPFIGIDFGTSTCSMSWYNPETGQAEILRNAEGKDETPSVVYFGPGEPLVGAPAEDMLEDPRTRGQVIRSVKRDLVTATRLALAGGRRVTTTEVAARILGKLKRDAEQLHFHHPVRRAVITCPAAFDELQLDKIREAATVAGFDQVELLPEPVAAALAYAQAGLRVGSHVLVYDLGGGTFDLALLAREENGSFRVALEPRGLARCGGDDFDRALYDHCDEVAVTTLGRGITLTGEIDPNFLRQCRQRKETLSAAERAAFSAYLASPEGSVHFVTEVDRAHFEALISPSIEATVRLTRGLVEEARQAGLAPDTVVLIGGSSRVPLAQRRLHEALPVAPEKWQKQDVAVALGAALHGHLLWQGTGAAPTPGAQAAGQTPATSPVPDAIDTAVAAGPAQPVVTGGAAATASPDPATTQSAAARQRATGAGAAPDPNVPSAAGRGPGVRRFPPNLVGKGALIAVGIVVVVSALLTASRQYILGARANSTPTVAATRTVPLPTVTRVLGARATGTAVVAAVATAVATSPLAADTAVATVQPTATCDPALCDATATSSTNRTYVDTAHGFALSYAADWTPTSTQVGAIPAYIVKAPSGNAMVSVVIEQSPDLDAAGLRTQLLAGLTSFLQASGYSADSAPQYNTATVSGVQAQIATVNVTSPSNGTTGVARCAVLTANQHFYLLVGLVNDTTADTADQDIQQVQAVLNSFALR